MDCVFCDVRTELLHRANLDKRQSRPFHDSGGYSQASHRGGAGFNFSSVHVIFVAEKVTLQHVFLPVLRFCLVSFIPQLLHTHLEIALTRRTNGRGLRNLPKSSSLYDIGEGKHAAVKVLSLCFFNASVSKN